MANSILWHNENRTVTLIDIPRSIAAAQGTVQHPCYDQLLSSEPLQASFPSNEPKTAAAKAKVGCNAVQSDVHREYVTLYAEALEHMRTQREAGEWCSPRVANVSRVTKRKRDDEGQPVRTRSVSAADSNMRYRRLTSVDCSENHDCVLAVTDAGIVPSATIVSNETDDTIVLPAKVDSTDEPHHYRIPPASSFCLGDCRKAQGFRAALREQAEQEGTRKNFDFILLDPPWPNRSVRRTHKTAGSTYKIMPNLRDTEDLLLGLDLDMLMTEDCLVGVWVTNKEAVRELVLGDGGLFDSLGLQLVEDWIWLKTTVHGEPVTPLDAVWRKPYEVLLLGRKRKTTSANGAASTVDTNVKRRVMIGVPDLHSRKPCLKELIEPFMPAHRTYRALEVFARYLVAGWWSWGDECIKFNDEAHWTRP